MIRRGAVAAAGLAVVLASCGTPRTSAPAPATTTHPTAPSSTSPAAPPPSRTSTSSSPAAPPTVATTTTPLRPAPSTTAAPQPRPATVITRGDPTRRLVALTFDAGSDAGNTARILDLLAADDIHATFGLTGQWAQANADLARRIAADGHQIVNHSLDHLSFTGASTNTERLPASQRMAELAQAETLIRQVTGSGTNGWFRPPYGDRDASVDVDAGAAGYRYELLWTLDSFGWKGIPAANVAARCLAGVDQGAILLFHVGSASTDADALPAIIDGLRATGYGFATVAEIL